MAEVAKDACFGIKNPSDSLHGGGIVAADHVDGDGLLDDVDMGAGCCGFLTAMAMAS